MRTKPTNLTLNDGVKGMAKDLIEVMKHSSLTSLVEQLIREEYGRRIKPLSLEEKKPVGAVFIRPPRKTDAALNDSPVSYRKTKPAKP